MDKKDFIEFGKITKFNRKTGDLTIRTIVDNADDYEETSIFFIEIDGGLVPFFTSSVKIRDSKTIQVLIEDYDDPEKAAQFVDCAVFISPDKPMETSDNEFYFHEIIGYNVLDQKHGDIGILEDILDRPEQEILQIRHQGKEILIPLVDEIFEKVNHNKKQLLIRAPEGLIDLYLDE
jgi:16S rRNA processing protein RimM